RQYRRGVHLVDDGRSANFVAGAQQRAPIARRFEPYRRVVYFEDDPLEAMNGGRRRFPFARGDLLLLDFVNQTHANAPNVDDLNVLLGRAMPVDSLMLGVKRASQIGDKGMVDRTGSRRGAQLVALATITAIGEPHEPDSLNRKTVRRQLAEKLVFDRSIKSSEFVEVDTVHVTRNSAPKFVGHVCCQQSKSRGEAGGRRHHDARNPELTRDIAGEHRTPPAESDQREISRIVTAANTVEFNSLDHIVG